MSSVNENQPMTMALVPTPLLTEPLAKSWAMTDAATDAVCCHKTETKIKTDPMKMMAREVCETGREGNGFTLRSEPSESSSSCQPGKVAKSSMQMKEKMMAIMLRVILIRDELKKKKGRKEGRKEFDMKKCPTYIR